MVIKKKRGRKPGVKVGPYKKEFNVDDYLSPVTVRSMCKDISNAIQKLNAKLTIIKRMEKK